jgi:predicted ABC-type exoprotein transport system permease subunit
VIIKDEVSFFKHIATKTFYSFFVAVASQAASFLIILPLYEKATLG